MYLCCLFVHLKVFVLTGAWSCWGVVCRSIVVGVTWAGDGSSGLWVAVLRTFATRAIPCHRFVITHLAGCREEHSNAELRLGWCVKKQQLQTDEWHSWSKHLNGFISGHPPPPTQSMYNYRPCERGNCRAEEMKVRLLSAQIWAALLILPVRPSESRPRFNLFQLLWYIFTFNSAVINNGGSSDKYILFPAG